jgi:hypothetical protein
VSYHELSRVIGVRILPKRAVFGAMLGHEEIKRRDHRVFENPRHAKAAEGAVVRSFNNIAVFISQKYCDVNRFFQNNSII